AGCSCNSCTRVKPRMWRRCNRAISVPSFSPATRISSSKSPTGARRTRRAKPSGTVPARCSASRRRRKRGGAGCTNCAPTPISTFACRGISSAVNNTRLALTPGEPAGIGPDLALRLAGREQPCEVVAIADPQLLEQRAARLEVDVQLRRVDYDAAPRPQPAGTLLVDPVARAAPTMPGT